MKTKANKNQDSGLKSRPEQLSTAEPATAEQQLWNVGYADREFAKLQGDPVLVQVCATTKEEAETKAREMGTDDRCAGLWAWLPTQATTEEAVPVKMPPPSALRATWPRLDFAKRQANRQLPTEAVVSLLRTNAPDFFALAEVVGEWVWIQFADKQPRAITRQLAELGFHWNAKRQLWQHPCGHVTEGSPIDPRAKYGAYHPAEVVA
jgi:hypothetical protein